MNAVVATVPALANDLLVGSEWGPEQVLGLFQLAADIKARPEHYRSALVGRFLAMIFEKPSLRTRVTFEVGIASMGGGAVFLDHTQARLGERESVHDVAKNLERWVQGIVARVFEHSAGGIGGEFIHSGDQRALGPVPSVPGIRGLFHPRGTLREPARIEICLHRRWEQRLPFAFDHRGAAGRACSRGNASWIRTGPRGGLRSAPQRTRESRKD